MKQWSLFAVAVFVLAACGGSGSSDESFVQIKKASAKETCEAFKAKLPADYVQSFVTVPEEYEKPSGRQIQVFYYHNFKANGGTPIVFFNGGPGSTSHGDFRAMAKEIEKNKMSFVFIDQRGTGCSTNYPTEASAETFRRLQYYGSTEIVKDAETIRKVLVGENGKWKVFGQSYGGYITHRYVALYPQSIAAAYSHGQAIAKNASLKMMYRLLSQKRVGALYFEKFPEDRARWDAMRSRISDGTCFTDGDDEVCGSGVLDAAIYIIGFRDAWDYFHKSINAVNIDDARSLRAWTAELAKDYIFDDGSIGATIVGTIEAVRDENNEGNCRGGLKLLKARGEDPSGWPFNQCRLHAAFTGKSKSDRLWDQYINVVTRRVPLHLDAVMSQLNANPNLPFYLYSGKLDMIVPTEAFDAVVNEMVPRVKYTEFPNSGHDGFFTEDQIWSDLKVN